MTAPAVLKWTNNEQEKAVHDMLQERGIHIFYYRALTCLSKDVINYCYHAMGEHVAVRGAITL